MNSTQKLNRLFEFHQHHQRVKSKPENSKLQHRCLYREQRHHRANNEADHDSNRFKLSAASADVDRKLSFHLK